MSTDNVISINNLDENVVIIVGKFADGIKIDDIADGEEGYPSLHQDQDQIGTCIKK